MSKPRRPIDILRRTRRKPGIVRALHRVGLGLFLVLASFAVISYTRAGARVGTYAGVSTRAYAATSSELNFQARLTNVSGGIVPDGNSYSVQFKLYDAASGGTNEWTETQSGMTVKNGYLSVRLGSVTPFSTSIDWSQEHWLTMNVNGDGEMNPRLKLTAVPYAFRAGQADRLTNGSGSLTANDLAQLAPSSVQAVNTAVAALRINQQGAGLLAQLQGNGADVLTIAKTGDLTSTGAASFDGNGTFKGGQLTVGTASQQGKLIMQDGGGNTLTLQSGAQTGNLTFTLPTSYGNNLECLKTNGSGVLSFGGCAPANAYTNGGNSFGVSATIGTQDSNSLALITGGTQRMLIDTSGNITLGTADATGSLLVLDTKNNAGDPTGSNGAMYYNSFMGKFRCYENGGWTDCISGASANASANFVSGLQNVPTNTTGAVVETMIFTSSTAVSNVAGVTGFTAPANGSFRTCMVKNNAAITAGTLSVRWRVNGASVGSPICTMDSTNNRQTAGALNSGVVTFNAGDTIGLAFDTSAGFLPSGTNDFTVYWSVDYTGGGGGGGGNVFDLQDAYDNSISASILTANNKDLTVNLANTAIDSNFIVDIASGSTGEFKVQNNGTDVLRINSNGDITSSGGLTLGNSTSTTAGTIRWTGLDFEGFDGATWQSLTTGGGGGSGISSNYVNLVKQTNETVNNSIALQDDNELAFSIGANEEWTYRFVVQANSGATPDLRFAVTAPSGATCFVSFDDPEGATSDGQYGCGVSTARIPGNGTVDLYEITGSVKNGANPGVVRLQWAQFTLNASNTVVYAGSYLTAYRTIGSGGAGQPFAQSGNAFGTTAVLGTTDNNALNFITNGNQVLNLATSGLATFQGGVTANGALTVNSGGLAVTGNGSISGSLTIGSGNALSISSSGDITGTMQALNGSSTANGAGANSTMLVLTSVTNFDIGNYVQVSSTNCSTGVNVCYAKITAIDVGTNTLTISPALSWANSSAVAEYHVPELGGSNTSQALANRFGRGYFISGIATGNGTTYYNENSIQTSLTSFDLLNTGVTTLNIGGAATTLNIGGAGTTTTIGGTVQFTGDITAPTSGTSGYLSRSGTTLSPSNSGDNFTTSGNISTTGTGTISSAGQITGTGGLSITGTSTINGNSISNTQFTFGGAGTITTSSNGNLTLVPNGSGVLALNTGTGGTATTNITTLQRTAAGGLTFDLNDGGTTTLTLSNSGAGAANLNLNDGGLYTAGTQRLTNGGALQNITGDNTDGVSFNANVITGGTLGTARGGTGVNGSSAANGQLLIGNGSGFTLASLTNNAGLTITNGAGSIGLEVNYGSTSTTAVRGDTGLVCSSGTGNLTGGGNSITLGSGGTCNALDTAAAVSFGTSVTTPVITSAGTLTISSGGTSDLTLDSASNKLVFAASDTSVQRTAAGSFTIDLNDTSATSLVINNSGTGAANLNLSDGGLQVAGTSVLTNGAALQNLSGFGQTSGNFSMSGTGTFATGTGAVGLNGATTISTSANSTSSLTVNGTTGTAATAVNIAQTGAAGNLAMTNSGATSQALVSLTQNTSAYTGTGLLINMASGSGTFASGNFLDLQLNGTSRFKVDNTGALTINSTNSNALQITNTSGLAYFDVDTSAGRVTVGTADATTVLFVLDSSSTTTDPGVVAGAMYYRTSDSKFRCAEGTAWKDCLSGADFSATLSSNFAVTNAGLTAVTGFSFTATAGETWEVTVNGSTSANNTTGDIACDLMTAGTWGTGQSYNEGVHYSGTGAITNRTATAAASTTTQAGTLTVNNGDNVVRPIQMTYRFVVTGTGTVSFRCGNAATGAGRTSTLNSGAIMLARRID